MNTRSEIKVCAVTVTYGNRFHLVKQVIERLATLDVHQILVIDNGSAAESATKLAELTKRLPVLKVVTLPENMGSAAGFKKGLLVAEHETDAEFIWLLDDDNLPEENALRELVSVYAQRSEMCCLLSLRKDRVYRKVFNDKDVKRKFRCNNSFVDYSLRNWFRKKFMYSVTGKKNHIISVPYAPYGGLFFPKSLLKTVGYPNEELYLYMDDHEFSRRIKMAGYPILLVRKSLVSDIETSWHAQKKYPLFHRFRSLIEGDTKKTYFVLRNSTYFERKYFVTNRVEYAVNKWLFTATFYLICICTRRSDRIELFKQALEDSKRLK